MSSDEAKKDDEELAKDADALGCLATSLLIFAFSGLVDIFEHSQVPKAEIVALIIACILYGRIYIKQRKSRNNKDR